MSAGTLFVVATPIGNLEDITLRALRVLKEADVIAAEDTRRTAKLLAHHVIATSTLSFHEHNSRSRIPRLLARLEAGQRVALVTDAGTPGISDPGIELVRACIDAGIRVDPIPGRQRSVDRSDCVRISLGAASRCLGFLQLSQKTESLGSQRLLALHGSLCFFEAPHRIARTLSEAAEYFGTRPIVVGRELTKLHQEFLRGTAQEVASRLGEPRGEFTVIVGPVENARKVLPSMVSDAQLADEFGHHTEHMGLGRRQAISDPRPQVRAPGSRGLRGDRARQEVNRPELERILQGSLTHDDGRRRCLIHTS